MYAAANEGLLKNPRAVAAMSRSNEELMEYIESKMWQPGALLPPRTPTTLTTHLMNSGLQTSVNGDGPQQSCIPCSC